LNSQEYEELLEESCGHLKEGRYRMALKSAQKAYEANPDDDRAIRCYALSKLENGFPEEAADLADTAVENSSLENENRFCRAYILYRMDLYDNSLADLNYILINNKEHYDAHLIKARIMTSLKRFKEAEDSVNSALKINKTEEAESIKEFIRTSSGYNQKIFGKSVSRKDLLLKSAEEAFHKKEYWFALWAVREVIKDRKYVPLHKEASLLELECLLNTFHYKEAFETAERMTEHFRDDEKFNLVFRRILKKYPEGEQKVTGRRGGYTEHFENNYFSITSIKCFDFLRSVSRKKRDYLIQFNEKEIRYIGVEVVIKNPFYNNKDVDIEGIAVWFQNGIETGRHRFSITLKKEWQHIEFVQSWGTNEPVFWKRGTGKVLIILDNHPVCEKWFDIKDFEIPEDNSEAASEESIYKDEEPEETEVKQTEAEESIEDLLNELNNFTGLAAVKQSLWDFVTYLKFINERKKHGLKTIDDLSVHCVFTGNPGTGKTTVARKLGRIFKAMGLLKSGHIVEVDRAALVGQYIGETAQKTEKAINEASGGILFIDEAYTLSRKGSNQDFGQEAIDILLKRMEDRKDDFVVIAAGYPDGMQDFISSNPGLKSRFNHFFHFEDYTPDELVLIFRQMTAEEDFIITEDALDLLKKEFVHHYRKRDKSFGNARLAKKYLNDIKLSVSRRLSEDGNEHSREAFTTIIREDIERLLAETGSNAVRFNIDEEKLELLLGKLNSLTGLEGVKKEIAEIVKLTRYYIENGDDPQKNISGHLVFLGNPGTGKTTVARLFSEIYSALGLLPKGHLVEVDRQALVGQYVGQTAIKTKEVIDSAMGGTLFIDEVYSLVKSSESDFGRESIDTLIKRMEDDKGRFILIAAGYTDETENFLSVNPGLSSRFYKKIHFDDYSPAELLIIAERFLEDKKLLLCADAGRMLYSFVNDAYNKRDKKFGNARFVRNITDKVIRKHLLHIAGMSSAERTVDNTSVISAPVVQEVISDFKEIGKGMDPDPENLLSELNELIGLDEVKQNTARLISSLKVAGLREKRGLKSVPKVLNAVFYGEPGTGKATTVKILGRIFKNMGLLSSGHVVTANKINMTGAYITQSRTKTTELINKAKGGILYIEDAEYLESELTQGSEILDALLEGITTDSGEIVFIMSGNNKGFCKDIHDNNILSKYFVNYFFFKSYSPRELVEIAYTLAEENSYSLDEGAMQLLMDMFTSLHKNGKTTENARLVKEILYSSISVQEERLFSHTNPDDDDLITITYEDVKKASEKFKF
jgi:SpoVK/Ycf46/Vps4 family AAA+-type ATPase